MKKLIVIMLAMLGLVAPTALIVKSVKFDQECGGYLKQAANAATPELALERLNVAIDYIEANGLTDEYTSIFWKTEDENLGFWYKNILNCREELESCLESSQLEKTNVLMKVRESLTGTRVPEGISVYPNNLLWGILRIISMLIIAFSIVWGVAIINRY